MLFVSWTACSHTSMLCPHGIGIAHVPSQEAFLFAGLVRSLIKIPLDRGTPFEQRSGNYEQRIEQTKCIRG